MNTSEVLYTAADLIEERGWIKGPGGWRGERGLCLEGALAAAAGLDLLSDYARLDIYGCPAYDAVAAYLDRHPVPRSAPIRDALFMWNDAPGRTAAEVVEVLRAAAVIESAKESADEREQVSA